MKKNKNVLEYFNIMLRFVFSFYKNQDYDSDPLCLFFLGFHTETKVTCYDLPIFSTEDLIFRVETSEVSNFWWRILVLWQCFWCSLCFQPNFLPRRNEHFNEHLIISSQDTFQKHFFFRDTNVRFQTYQNSKQTFAFERKSLMASSKISEWLISASVSIF